MKQKISLAHSPDSDDAFMFYALAEGKVDDRGFDFVHELSDIETLNQRTRRGELDVSAISFHAYPDVADRYALLPHGASFGDGYGPVVVAARPLAPADLDGVVVGIPGEKTSAALALQLWRPGTRTTLVPFDQILPRVRAGELAAGVIIHEGQLTYAEEGLHAVVDLGAWWLAETGLPLPLGGNVIRKALGPGTVRAVSDVLGESIAYGLSHREEALTYAMRFARDLDRDKADRFVGMYVNDWTRGYGEKGRRAIELFLGRAAAAGLVPSVRVEFAGEGS
ncbi:MAG TPA: MqnA/MqnD/SBP family protein [Thermoanaerobaculia bacterium]|jgi:1,4-dihydroxy-6-naphthoate synthase|nr:MqnA/MqnD/SBP family protein [Thermoanaerobaculia bacterium]